MKYKIVYKRGDYDWFYYVYQKEWFVWDYVDMFGTLERAELLIKELTGSIVTYYDANGNRESSR